MQGPVLVWPSTPSPCPWASVPGALTVEAAPAADVAGRLVGQDVARWRETGELDSIPQLGAA